MIRKTGALLMFAIGFVLGTIFHQATGSQKHNIARTELINADLAEFRGKQVKMYITEISPGVATPRHKHPGIYLSYVLEGSGNLEQDGKPTLQLEPGVSYFMEATDAQSTWHTVWNTSKDKPLKSLSVLISDKGIPGTVFDK